MGGNRSARSKTTRQRSAKLEEDPRNKLCTVMSANCNIAELNLEPRAFRQEKDNRLSVRNT